MEPTVLIGALSLVIAILALFLNYVAQCYNSVDTPFERENQISERGVLAVKLSMFTNKRYSPTIEFSRVEVREDSSWPYRLKKLVYPPTDLNGHSVVKFRITAPGGVPDGKYDINGWKPDTTIKSGIIQVSNGSDVGEYGTIAIKTDSVNPNEVLYDTSAAVNVSTNLTLDQMERDGPTPTYNELMAPEGRDVVVKNPAEDHAEQSFDDLSPELQQTIEDSEVEKSQDDSRERE